MYWSSLPPPGQQHALGSPQALSSLAEKIPNLFDGVSPLRERFFAGRTCASGTDLRGELRLTANDRPQNLDVFYFCRIDGMRIFGQHDEVGEFADRDRSFD